MTLWPPGLHLSPGSICVLLGMVRRQKPELWVVLQSDLVSSRPSVFKVLKVTRLWLSDRWLLGEGTAWPIVPLLLVSFLSCSEGAQAGMFSEEA